MRIWWAKLLRQAVQNLDMDWVAQRKTIKIISACTGCSAESAVMKAGTGEPGKKLLHDQAMHQVCLIDALYMLHCYMFQLYDSV